MISYDDDDDDHLLCAGVNVYQDCKGLKRLFKSIYDHMDKIFVIDGRYPDWGDGDGDEDLSDYSTDGTDEYCRSLGPKVEYVRLFAPQKDKRSKYCELAEGYRFMLVIDADEFIITQGVEWPKCFDYQNYPVQWRLFKQQLMEDPSFEEELQRNDLRFHNLEFMTEPNVFNTFGKILYKPSEVYYSNHWELHRRSDDKLQHYRGHGSLPYIRGITMTGDENMRPYERLQIDIDYQWNLNLKENAITESQHKDPKWKRKFAKSVVHEANVWRPGYVPGRWDRQEEEED